MTLRRLLIVIYMAGYAVLLCPLPLCAQPLNIVSGEYFIDTDPGFGAGTSISISPDTSIVVPISISTNALSPGFHDLNVRFKDADGNWGLSTSKPFYVGGTEQIGEIVKAEYYLDTDPGYGEGTVLSTSTSDSLHVMTQLTVSDLSSGFHRLYVRAQDTQGRWGMTQFKPFYVGDPIGNPSLSTLEYYVDTDPGFGKGSAISITVGDTITTTELISTSSYTPGFHTVYVRGQDINGNWGFTESRPFYIGKPLENLPLSSVEYYVDTDPGYGQGTEIPITASDSVFITRQLSASNFARGFHTLYTRAQGVHGIWGIVESSPFYIGGSDEHSPIVSLEYFFDVEPGYGKGTEISVTPADSILLMPMLVPGGLDMGIHVLTVRAKNALGIWGLGDQDSFLVGTEFIPANRPPMISLSEGALAYVSGDDAVVIDAEATVSDADGGDFDTGALTVDFAANGTANDRLSVSNQGAAAGEIGVTGSEISFGGIAVGIFTGGTDGATPLVVTFNANSSPEAAQALVRRITYGNISENPSTNLRTVRFLLTDGNGGTSGEATKTITVNAVEPPSAPTNLTVTTLSYQAIQLSWDASPDLVLGYYIERKAEDETVFSVLDTVGAETNTYTDEPDLPGNTIYTYRVRAFNVSEHSSYSNVASATTYSDLLGDVNNNTQVNITDALIVATYEINPSTSIPNNGAIELGDVNSDGGITITDALIIATYDIAPANPNLPSGIAQPIPRNGSPVIKPAALLNQAVGGEIILDAAVQEDFAGVDNVITVSVHLRNDGIAERVGAYSAWIQWNPLEFTLVDHMQVEPQAFTHSYITTDEIQDGILRLNGLNVQGIKREAELVQLKFRVVQEPQQQAFDIALTTLVAAQTFRNLLPITKIELPEFDAAPTAFALYQNYPNPFNPQTTIAFDVPKKSTVQLSIYNVLGQRIRVLVDYEIGAGRHKAVWDGRDEQGREVRNGLYLIQMTTKNTRQIKKMVVLK